MPPIVKQKLIQPQLDTIDIKATKQNEVLSVYNA